MQKDTLSELHHIIANNLGIRYAVTGAAPIVTTPPEYSIHNVENTLPTPSRKRGVVNVSRIDDFVALVQDQAGASSDYKLFSTLTGETIEAVMNWNGWRDHRVKLSVVKSAHFAAFEQAMVGVRNQRDFIRLIEDFSYLITKPEAAAMLEVAQKFRVQQNVRYTSVQETANGNVAIEYVKTNDAGTTDAKGAIQKLPEEFEVTVPVYEGEPNSTLRIRIGYDLRDGVLSFGLHIHQWGLIQRHLAKNRHDLISQKLDGQKVHIGAADPVNAMR